MLLYYGRFSEKIGLNKKKTSNNKSRVSGLLKKNHSTVLATHSELYIKKKKKE